MVKLDTVKSQSTGKSFGEASSIIEQFTVAELIPHSPPMVLLDRIVKYSEQSLSAEIDLHEDSKFFDVGNNGVPAWVGIEYMAQAIALFAGIKAKLKGQPIKLGFLLGTRKYHIDKKYLEGNQTYQINVTQLYMDDSGLASFDCDIKHGDEFYARAKLNVFETDDARKVLETD
ncbi:hotdog family protein [Aliikangiella coralliicola]|uniref:3-hydroxyacyl-ACP dehydratase n=1 Tax=Aliikangiella coralliicola TaxID=2592383 RepID=A0A545UEF8_9GAMM|nr:hotdog family protein [Aliikangiella coralliicola]TQV87852.1 3-hydroxyacyl-ACP dehydratase [Aliikangiella coralliicola]